MRQHKLPAALLALLFSLPDSVSFAQAAEPLAEKLPEGVIGTFGVGRFRAGGQLMGIQLSPDGRLLATSNASQLLRIWDVATGRLLPFGPEVKDAPKLDWLQPFPRLEARPRGDVAAPAWGSRRPHGGHLVAGVYRRRALSAVVEHRQHGALLGRRHAARGGPARLCLPGLAVVEAQPAGRAWHQRRHGRFHLRRHETRGPGPAG